MLWIKLVHLAAIAIWAAGLVGLPGLCVQRGRVADDAALHRLQAMVRFLYVALVSPAAFVAVGSGTALIFLRGVFEPWLSLKLALVGAMVALHIVTGLLIVRLFEEGNAYPVRRFVATLAATVAVIVAILAVVLAKPPLPDMLPEALSQPGALGRLLEGLNPFRRS